MFTMTLKQAVEIQAEQIKYYGKFVPGGEEALRERVEAITGDLSGRGLNDEISVADVNALIPRGVAIESIVYDMTDGEVRFGGD